MTNVERTLKNKPKKWIVNLIFFSLIIFGVMYSFQGAQVNMLRLNSFYYTITTILSQIVKFQPNFFFGVGNYEFVEGVIYLVLETLAIAFLGTLLGAILALPFGFLASKNIVGPKASKIGETILVMIRVFPEIILALIIVKGFGMNALTGLLTIGIHSIGMLGKLFAEMIDNMDRSSLEALDSVGANVLQKIRFSIIPQIAADLSSVTLYRLDINLRSATILGMVSSSGIGAALMLSAENSDWPTLGTILVAIVIMVLAVDSISSRLRTKLV